MHALLAVNWEWELRGTLIVIMAVGVLCGSLYLILGTNLGARLGFRETLAPPIIAREDAGEEPRLLLGGAESVDHRADHRDPERQDADRIGAGDLLGPDEALGRGPAGTAVFLRPGRGDPPLFGKHAVP